MRLEQYIELEYTSKRQFALDNGMSAQQVNGMLNRGYWYVFEVAGELMLMAAKKQIKSK
jgi:hypothetical protein